LTGEFPFHHFGQFGIEPGKKFNRINGFAEHGEIPAFFVVQEKYTSIFAKVNAKKEESSDFVDDIREENPDRGVVCRPKIDKILPAW
jgi:hypothetical protein